MNYMINKCQRKHHIFRNNLMWDEAAAAVAALSCKEWGKSDDSPVLNCDD